MSISAIDHRIWWKDKIIFNITRKAASRWVLSVIIGTIHGILPGDYTIGQKNNFNYVFSTIIIFF